MREIKFRLWSAGRFSYWGFVRHGFAGLATNNVEPLTMEEKQERSEQYTGLKDKNGKEVFEADIVEWDEKHGGHREVVQWSDVESAWVCHNPKDNGSWLSGISEIAIVIGNIHENPELLEKE